MTTLSNTLAAQFSRLAAVVIAAVIYLAAVAPLIDTFAHIVA